MIRLLSSNGTILLLELVVYSLAVAVSILAVGVKAQWYSKVSHAFTNLARRRWLAILFSIVVVLTIRGALVTVLPTPVPGIHDEYSYILGGDTFASGRITNPPHAMWKSLETFYVIQNPTYASMYPPAQALVLAAGDLIGGKPWIGVYLSVAAMCGAICWMLQGWVPPQWALVGALVTAFRLGIYSYWSESYWGGAVAAIGGALAFGTLPRLLKKPSALSAIILGLGVLLLANSRPFEGLLVAATIFGTLALRWRSFASNSFQGLLKQLVVPLGLTLLAGGSAMLFYFWRVTGNPLQMPYELHSKIYEITGPFLWQKVRAYPDYRYAVMEQYHVSRQAAAYDRAHHLRSWLTETLHKAEALLIFYFWPVVLPTVLAIPLLWHNAKVRFCLIAFGIMFVGLALEIWPMTLHYPAPITAITVLLLVQVIRAWRSVKWRKYRVGLAIARTVPLFCAAMLTLRLAAAAFHVPVPDQGLAPWFTVVPGNLYRAQAADFLSNQPGLQLALVRYSADHHVDEEWVHNAADIDGSKVVWARYSDDEQNQRLLEYFKQRHVWLVDVGAKQGTISPLITTPKPLHN